MQKLALNNTFLLYISTHIFGNRYNFMFFMICDTPQVKNRLFYDIIFSLLIQTLIKSDIYDKS